MRNIRVVFAVLSLSVVLVAGVADELQAQEKRQGWIKRLRYRRELRRELQGEIQLSGAFALYPMAVKWAEEFRKIHPKVRIDISAGGAGKGITDALAKVVDLGMVSRDIYPQELEKGAFPIAVVKDAVVPTINSNNPLIDQILATGLKPYTAPPGSHGCTACPCTPRRGRRCPAGSASRSSAGRPPDMPRTGRPAH